MPQIHLYLKVMGSPSATPTRLLVDIREELLQTRGQKWNCLSRTRLSNIREQNWKTFFFTMPCSDADPVPPGTAVQGGGWKSNLAGKRNENLWAPGFPLCQPPRSGKALLGGLVPPVCQPKAKLTNISRYMLGLAQATRKQKLVIFMFSFPLCKEVSPRSSDQALLGRSHQPVARSGYRPRTLGYRHCWAG